ncbi:MAG: LysE family transporter [Pseudomonadota bacterium]
MIQAILTGYFTALSLILAIGAQNAFVLRQGLLRAHVFVICLFCAVSDALLITAGVLGFGELVTLYPAFPAILAVAGAAFLLVYGFTRFRAAHAGTYEMELSGDSPGLWAALGVVFACTWLNPHVYLDTLGLIGAVSTRFPDHTLVFGIAASAASFSFFFALGYGARLLAPVMTSARAWRVLDAGIGCVMWLIAAGLFASIIWGH